MTRPDRQAIADSATVRPWSQFGQAISAGRHRIGDTMDYCCFGHSGQECTNEQMDDASQGDAELIVAAVNSFDAHLALEAAAQAILDWADFDHDTVPSVVRLRDALTVLTPESER